MRFNSDGKSIVITRLEKNVDLQERRLRTIRSGYKVC